MSKTQQNKKMEDLSTNKKTKKTDEVPLEDFEGIQTNDFRRPKVSLNDIEKSMTPFTGDDTYPIETWLSEFKDTAEVMGWCDVEQLIYGKRLLQGTARLFLRSIGSVKSWSDLEKDLLEEFGPRLNTAASGYT